MCRVGTRARWIGSCSRNQVLCAAVAKGIGEPPLRNFETIPINNRLAGEIQCRKAKVQWTALPRCGIKQETEI